MSSIESSFLGLYSLEAWQVNKCPQQARRVWGKFKSRCHEKVPRSCLCPHMNTPIGSHTRVLYKSKIQWPKTTANSTPGPLLPFPSLALIVGLILTGWQQEPGGLWGWPTSVEGLCTCVCVCLGGGAAFHNQGQMEFTLDVSFEFWEKLSEQ